MSVHVIRLDQATVYEEYERALMRAAFRELDMAQLQADEADWSIDDAETRMFFNQIQERICKTIDRKMTRRTLRAFFSVTLPRMAKAAAMFLLIANALAVTAFAAIPVVRERVIKFLIESTSAGERYAADDEWIYYRLEDEESGLVTLNKMRSDGTDAQRILDGGGLNLAIDGDFLYFTNHEGLHRVRTDGSDHELLEINAQWVDAPVFAAEGYIYVREDDNIHCYSAKPWAKVNELYLPGNYDKKYMISDGFIYLSDIENAVPAGGKIYKVRTDGTEFAELLAPPEDYRLTYWSIFEDELYYGLASVSEGAAQLRRMSLDGPEDELVLEGIYVAWVDGEWVYGTRFEDEPEIIPSFDFEEGKTYNEYHTKGFWRASLGTGEFQYLGDQDYTQMRPVGDWIIFPNDNGWAHNGIPILYTKDMSEEFTAPVPEK